MNRFSAENLSIVNPLGHSKMETVMLSVIHAIKARFIFRTLGGKVAAGYLKNRGYSFEQARYMLGLKFRTAQQ